MTKTKEELIQRAHDAKQLLQHPLIQEFFCDIDTICYNAIINSKSLDVQEREQMYLFARASRMFKGLFEQTINEGTFREEVAIKKIRNIHE